MPSKPQLDETQIAGLQRLLSLLNPDTLTREDFLASFEKVLQRIKELEDKNGVQFTGFDNAIRTFAEKLNGDTQQSVASIRSDLQTLIDQQLAALGTQIDAKLEAVDNRMAQVRDGIDADPEAIKAAVLADIALPDFKERINETPEDIRNKLELLQGEERLKRSAIDGLDEEIASLKKSIASSGGNTFYGGSRGIELYVNGAKKGLTQYLNLVPGSGVSLSYNTVGQRVDVTITASGGGGGGSLSVVTATGTIDDSNTSFTFSAEPTVVVVNGAIYRDGHGCTITGTSVVLDNPVGSGGDIYGLSAS